MDKKQLLVIFSRGMFPILIFIIIDEFYGLFAGIIGAFILGIIEILFVWFKEKQFDKFILFDTTLILVFGTISLITDNDLFFKIKPAVIQVLLLIMLALMIFTNGSLLQGVMKRYHKGIIVDNNQLKKMQKSMIPLFLIIFLHTILVFYSAIFMSTKAWGFITKGLFYIILAVYFLWSMIKIKIIKRKINNQNQ